MVLPGSKAKSPHALSWRPGPGKEVAQMKKRILAIVLAALMALTLVGGVAAYLLR